MLNFHNIQMIIRNLPLINFQDLIVLVYLLVIVEQLWAQLMGEHFITLLKSSMEELKFQIKSSAGVKKREKLDRLCSDKSILLT